MPFGGVGALGLMFQLRVDNRVPMLVLTLRSVLWGSAVVVIFSTRRGMVAARDRDGGDQRDRLDRAGARRPQARHAAAASVAQAPRAVMRIGLPVGVAGVLVVAYARIDQIIVFAIAGSKPAGLYGAVYNVLDQAHFVPISILTTLAPVMAAAWPADRARAAAHRAPDGGAAGDRLVRWRSRSRSSPPNRSCACVFGADSRDAARRCPCSRERSSSSLRLSERQPAAWCSVSRAGCFGISLLALVVNVVGNLILVPLAGFMGAAWMTLATEMVVFLRRSG